MKTAMGCRRPLVALVLGAALTACATPPLLAGDAAQSMRVQALTRHWRVHLPVDYGPSRRWPLVLVFHGLFGTAAEMEKLTGLDAVADRDGFIVVYPQGIDRSWAAGVNAPADRKGVDDLAFVAALLDRLEGEYRVDPARVIVTGFSNGAHLVQLLACRMAGRLYAAVPVSGTMPPDALPHCHPSRPLSVVAFHGTADPVDPYDGGKVKLLGGSPLLSAPRTLAAWARLDGCDGTPRTTTLAPLRDGVAVHRLDYTGCREGVKVRLYRIDGGGHTWPGGPQYLPAFMVGRSTHAVDASAIIGTLATAR